MPKVVQGLNSLTPTTSTSSGSGGIFPARVRFTLLNDTTDPKTFKKYGGWSSLGGIFFSRINTPNPSKDFTTDSFAKPLFPHEKNYPLKNEIVYIFSLPDSNIQSDVNDVSNYYIHPANIWNSTHHNAIPDPIRNNNLPPSQQQDYTETQAGAVRRVTDGGTEIDLGDTFTEKLQIKSLQPYEGDISFEGRWGQSIRFGSTINNSSPKNTWSKTGDNGDPITIIKNSQHQDDTDPWVPQVEDINLDKSSAYLTSTQLILIKVSSKSYDSYDTKPVAPDKFSVEQIILNSGRILFNTKSDSILLSSNDTINLNSVNSVTIDSPKSVFQSKEVLLGDKNANESVILGDKFLEDMQKLLTQLIALGTALQTPIGTPVPFTPNASIPVPAVNITQTATEMLNKIQTYKSKVSKTK